MKLGGFPLTIGADWAGIGADSEAIQSLIHHSTVTFASEIDDPSREVLQKFVSPEFMTADAMCRTPAGDRPVDVYVAGFPCQPFSAIGGQGRGQRPKGTLPSILPIT